MTPVSQPPTARDLELIGRAVRHRLRQPVKGAIARREAPELRAALERLERAGGTLRNIGDDPRAIAANAVILATVDASAIEVLKDGEVVEGKAFALTLGGRVNHTPDDVRVTFLLGADGAGAIVAELLGLARSMGTVAADAILDRIDRAIAAGGFGQRTRRTA